MAFLAPRVISPEYEPDINLPSEIEEDNAIPSEEEIRYLGNAWNYCNFFHKELNDCITQRKEQGEKFLFRACKNSLENLHHCYNWREPTEFKYNKAFQEETKVCLLQRDMFLKCYMVNGEPWHHCGQKWVDLYRCQFRKQPGKFTFN